MHIFKPLTPLDLIPEFTTEENSTRVYCYSVKFAFGSIVERSANHSCSRVPTMLCNVLLHFFVLGVFLTKQCRLRSLQHTIEQSRRQIYLYSTNMCMLSHQPSSKGSILYLHTIKHVGSKITHRNNYLQSSNYISYHTQVKNMRN